MDRTDSKILMIEM